MSNQTKHDNKPYAFVGQKCAVLNANNEFLVLRRGTQDWMPNPGRLDFPGGGLDKGEDPVEGIKREIWEEAGLEVVDLEPFEVRSYLEDDEFTVMIIYWAKSTTDEVKLSSEHTEYYWMSKEQILESDIADAYKEFVELLIDRKILQSPV